jgi:hypothetical protein
MTAGLKVVFHALYYTVTNSNFKRNRPDFLGKLDVFALATNIPIAGIKPAQGYQIPPRPEGTGSPLVKTR